MTTYVIKSPVAGFTGRKAGVAFADGRATAGSDATAALAYFRRHGYRITEQQAATPPAETPEETGPKRPVKSASKADWVSYWVSQGGDQTATEALTRDQLAELDTAPTSSEGDGQ